MIEKTKWMKIVGKVAILLLIVGAFVGFSMLFVLKPEIGRVVGLIVLGIFMIAPLIAIIFGKDDGFIG